MPGFGAAPPLPGRGRADRRQPGGGAAARPARSSGSSARTSPATRSAAGSGWKWAAPAGPPRSPRSPPPASGGRRSARAGRDTRALGPAPAPAGLRRAPASRRCAARMLATFAAHPERIPAAAGRELVLGWIDANGYDGANRAMRTHIFDPAGYPEEVPVTIAWGELDRLSARRSRSAAPPAPASSSSPASATRRRGTTPSWSPAPCSRAAPSRPPTDVLGEFGTPANRGGAALIVERTENPQWLSNAYLVADPEAGTGVLIDGNDELGPLLERGRARRDRDHPHPRHPSPRRPRRRPRRGAQGSSATRRWSPTRRPPPSSTKRSR